MTSLNLHRAAYSIYHREIHGFACTIAIEKYDSFRLNTSISLLCNRNLKIQLHLFDFEKSSQIVDRDLACAHPHNIINDFEKSSHFVSISYR